MLGRASGRAWKVFTFVEGLILVKDDRASAPENHVCVCELFCFFFLAAYARTLQRSDAVQSRTPLSFRKGLLWAGSHGLTRCLVPTCVWISVPSSSVLCELGKGDTRGLSMGSNWIRQVPRPMSTPGTLHSLLGGSPGLEGPETP